LLWNTIWQWQGPNRVRFFLWLTTHNRLLTNAERNRIHLSDDDNCSRYKVAPDDTLHVLRDCYFARKLWVSIMSPKCLTNFFSGSLQDWLLRELKDHYYGQLFGIASWLLWKTQNETIFENTSVTSD
ncbi:Putative ribonuclease H protein At1g65750, partial [Linum perenne]